MTSDFPCSSGASNSFYSLNGSTAEQLQDFDMNTRDGTLRQMRVRDQERGRRERTTTASSSSILLPALSPLINLSREQTMWSLPPSLLGIARPCSTHALEDVEEGSLEDDMVGRSTMLPPEARERRQRTEFLLNLIDDVLSIVDANEDEDEYHHHAGLLNRDHRQATTAMNRRHDDRAAYQDSTRTTCFVSDAYGAAETANNGERGRRFHDGHHRQ